MRIDETQKMTLNCCFLFVTCALIKLSFQAEAPGKTLAKGLENTSPFNEVFLDAIHQLQRLSVTVVSTDSTYFCGGGEL